MTLKREKTLLKASKMQGNSKNKKSVEGWKYSLPWQKIVLIITGMIKVVPVLEVKKIAYLFLNLGSRLRPYLKLNPFQFVVCYWQYVKFTIMRNA